MSEDVVLVDRPVDGVLRIRLNRPATHNAIDSAMVSRLRSAFDEAVDSLCVVVGSSTPGRFCAGADLNISDTERARVSGELYALYRQIVALGCPVVAAIEGAAVGGGAQLALACDLRIAGPDARIRFVGPAHGLAVGAWALGPLVGSGLALDLCLSTRTVTASEAVRIGLVERLADAPMAAALDYAAMVAELDPAAAARVKRIVHGESRLARLTLEADGNAGWAGGVPGSDGHRSVSGPVVG